MSPAGGPAALAAAVSRVPAPLRALLVALALAAVGLGGGSLLIVALLAVAPDLTVLPETVLRVLLLQGLSFGGVSALYLRARGLPREYVGISVPDLEGWLHAAAGYVLALVGAVTMVVVVVFFLGLTPAENRAAELGRRDPRVFLALAVLAVAVIGPGEELLFRGVVQALAGPTSGVALTVTLLFVPALVFAVIYERTGTVVVPAAAHGAYNATLFGIAYLSVAVG
ncbi:CPBP family intramembrane metalloprotease [Halobacteriales archaeon QS_1_69_70]|nr:MAG: CPBP family intramembrane metalloprotease [Halobacteriales archaeon QS_1_69_70]